MEKEDHTSLEVTDQPKDDDDQQSKDIPDYSKRKSSRFAFDWDSDYSSRQKGDKAMRKLDLQHKNAGTETSMETTESRGRFKQR